MADADDQAIQTTPQRQRPWDEAVAVPLPAEAGFTDAEHWAWSHIIRGEIADMRLASGADDGAGDDANEEIESEGGNKDAEAVARNPPALSEIL